MGTKPQTAVVPDAAGLWDRQEALLRAGLPPELLCAWSWLWARAGFGVGQADFTLSQFAELRDAAKATAKGWIEALADPWRLIEIGERKTGRRGGYSVDVLDPLDVLPQKLHRIDPPADSGQKELPLGQDVQEKPSEPTEDPATLPFRATAGEDHDEQNVRPGEGQTERSAPPNVRPGSGQTERLAAEQGESPRGEAPSGENVRSSHCQTERLAGGPSRTRVVSFEERNPTSSKEQNQNNQEPTQLENQARFKEGPGKADAIIRRAGGVDPGAIADRGTRAYEEAKSNAARRILTAVRKAEIRVGITAKDRDGKFMGAWVAWEWGHHSAAGLIGLCDVDEMVRDLAEVETFKKSPGAYCQSRGRKLVENKGGKWRAGSKLAREPPK